MLYDFKYISDMQLPTISHNLLRKCYFLLFGKRDVLKYFDFLARKRLSTALLGLFKAAICLQLEETIVVAIY